MPQSSTTNLETFKAKLLQRRQSLKGTASRLAEEALKKDTPAGLGETSAYRTHPADLGSEAGEQSRDLTLVEREEGELAEIDSALNRIAIGTYGSCENCGESISLPRLQALPEARYCVRCEAELEDEALRSERLSPH